MSKLLRPAPITFQGELFFPPPHTPSLTFPSGALHAILRGNTLHLHRANPLIARSGAEKDGAEVGRIRLHGPGWTAARRRIEKDDSAAQRWAVEVLQETGEGETSAPRRGSGVLLRKRSTPALHEATNSFSGKLAARMKRGKSISGTAALQQDGPPVSAPSRAEPLLVFAPSRQQADDWVEVLNDALNADSSFVHVSSGLTPSASLPVGLSSLSLGGPSSSSMTPSRHLPSTSPFPLPPTFNTGRRPSWLDRPPPPSPAVRRTPVEPISPGGTRTSSDVPAWIAATLAAHERTEQLEALKEAQAAKETAAPLRMRRSMSLLPAATAPVVASVPMGRSQSDGRRSMEGGRRLLGLMQGRRSSKKGAEELHLPLSRAPPLPSSSQGHSSAPYTATSGAKSSTSLADSLLSESHSTSNSSDRPSTPHDHSIPSLTSTPATPRPKSPFSAGQRTPRSFAETFQSQSGRHSPTGGPLSRSNAPSSDARSSLGHRSGDSATIPGRESFSEMHARRKSRYHLVEASTQSSTSTTSSSEALLASRRSASSREGSGGLERIVDPLDLISMMREEQPRPAFSPGLSPSFSSTRLHHLGPLPPSGLGGLSPPPRSMSRQTLASLGKSPTKEAARSSRTAERRRVVRQQSFGAVEEGVGEGSA